MTFEQVYARYLYELYCKNDDDKDEDRDREDDDDDEYDDDDDEGDKDDEEREDDEVLIVQTKRQIFLHR